MKSLFYIGGYGYIGLLEMSKDRILAENFVILYITSLKDIWPFGCEDLGKTTCQGCLSWYWIFPCEINDVVIAYRFQETLLQLLPSWDDGGKLVIPVQKLGMSDKFILLALEGVSMQH